MALACRPEARAKQAHSFSSHVQVPGRGRAEVAEALSEDEQKRFHGLPPVKRFKILEKERLLQMAQQKQHGSTALFCLPAKKRVCALQVFPIPEAAENEGHDILPKENAMILNKEKHLQAKTVRSVLRPVVVESSNLVERSSVPKVELPSRGVILGLAGDHGKRLHQNRRSTAHKSLSGCVGDELGSGVNNDQQKCVSGCVGDELVPDKGDVMQNCMSACLELQEQNVRGVKESKPDDAGLYGKEPTNCKPQSSAREEDSDTSDDETGDKEDIFCDVCKGSDADSSDPIVFCDGCNVMVHASCYGAPLVDGIPSGDWFCKQCESKDKDGSRKCCLCPSTVGAMKRTTKGLWAHLSCALFVPEVYYRRAKDKEGIECGHVPPWRWDMRCVLCATNVTSINSGGGGACIQCTEVGCDATFHVSCALDRGLSIRYRNANPLTKTPAIVIAFCHSHSRTLSYSERRRFKIVPRD